jgi:hypothetical protein
MQRKQKASIRQITQYNVPGRPVEPLALIIAQGCGDGRRIVMARQPPRRTGSQQLARIGLAYLMTSPDY